eukprot:2157780-Amphidinium_carterae.1
MGDPAVFSGTKDRCSQGTCSMSGSKRLATCQASMSRQCYHERLNKRTFERYVLRFVRALFNSYKVGAGCGAAYVQVNNPQHSTVDQRRHDKKTVLRERADVLPIDLWRCHHLIMGLREVTAYHWGLAQLTLGAHDINPLNGAERIFT